MKHRVWKFIPIILFFVGVLSIVLFIILVTMGPFLNWLEKGSLLLYPLLIYTMILYFFFIISLVQRFSTNDENILHQAYGWSLGLLIVIAFIF